MKKYTEIVSELNDLEEKIDNNFEFLGKENQKAISEYICPECKTGHLKIDYFNNNIIRCDFCRYTRSYQC